MSSTIHNEHENDGQAKMPGNLKQRLAELYNQFIANPATIDERWPMNFAAQLEEKHPFDGADFNYIPMPVEDRDGFIPIVQGIAGVKDPAVFNYVLAAAFWANYSANKPLTVDDKSIVTYIADVNKNFGIYYKTILGMITPVACRNIPAGIPVAFCAGIMIVKCMDEEYRPFLDENYPTDMEIPQSTYNVDIKIRSFFTGDAEKDRAQLMNINHSCIEDSCIYKFLDSSKHEDDEDEDHEEQNERDQEDVHLLMETTSATSEQQTIGDLNVLFIGPKTPTWTFPVFAVVVTSRMILGTSSGVQGFGQSMLTCNYGKSYMIAPNDSTDGEQTEPLTGPASEGLMGEPQATAVVSGVEGFSGTLSTDCDGDGNNKGHSCCCNHIYLAATHGVLNKDAFQKLIDEHLNSNETLLTYGNIKSERFEDDDLSDEILLAPCTEHNIMPTHKYEIPFAQHLLALEDAVLAEKSASDANMEAMLQKFEENSELTKNLLVWDLIGFDHLERNQSLKQEFLDYINKNLMMVLCIVAKNHKDHQISYHTQDGTSPQLMSLYAGKIIDNKLVAIGQGVIMPAHMVPQRHIINSYILPEAICDQRACFVQVHCRNGLERYNPLSIVRTCTTGANTWFIDTGIEEDTDSEDDDLTVIIDEGEVMFSNLASLLNNQFSRSNEIKSGHPISWKDTSMLYKATTYDFNQKLCVGPQIHKPNTNSFHELATLQHTMNSIPMWDNTPKHHCPCVFPFVCQKHTVISTNQLLPLPTEAHQMKRNVPQGSSKKVNFLNPFMDNIMRPESNSDERLYYKQSINTARRSGMSYSSTLHEDTSGVSAERMQSIATLHGISLKEYEGVWTHGPSGEGHSAPPVDGERMFCLPLVEFAKQGDVQTTALYDPSRHEPTDKVEHDGPARNESPIRATKNAKRLSESQDGEPVKKKQKAKTDKNRCTVCGGTLEEGKDEIVKTLKGGVVSMAHRACKDKGDSSKK